MDGHPQKPWTTRKTRRRQLILSMKTANTNTASTPHQTLPAIPHVDSLGHSGVTGFSCSDGVDHLVVNSGVATGVHAYRQDGHRQDCLLAFRPWRGRCCRCYDCTELMQLNWRLTRSRAKALSLVLSLGLPLALLYPLN